MYDKILMGLTTTVTKTNRINIYIWKIGERQQRMRILFYTSQTLYGYIVMGETSILHHN